MSCPGHKMQFAEPHGFEQSAAFTHDRQAAGSVMFVSLQLGDVTGFVMTSRHSLVVGSHTVQQP